MSINAQELIHGYLDDSLTAEQHKLLSEWIKSDSSHAQEFAAAVVLHDRLRNEWTNLEQREEKPQLPSALPAKPSARSWFALTTSVCLLLLAAVLIWQTAGVTPVSAAMVELDRIIATNSLVSDRTFSISVEKTSVPRDRSGRPSQHHGRPPKPSIDDAILHVRGPDQFVLIRKVSDDEVFVTGSNGRNSWAVRPDGPVRFSPDLSRFNRDVPGHEHSMPLNNLHDGLERLHKAYDVDVTPVEKSDDAAEADAKRSLLVGVRKPGFRGPERVEITYVLSTGQIRQIRFIEMPYGPKRLTLKMTVVEARQHEAAYFNHESHHEPTRVVEFEE